MNGVFLQSRQNMGEAIERLMHWLRSDDARASVQAANALLDRGHGKPMHNVKSESNVNMVRKIEEEIIYPEKREGDDWEDDEEDRLH